MMPPAAQTSAPLAISPEMAASGAGLAAGEPSKEGLGKKQGMDDGVPGVRVRWDRCSGIGKPEGPFPQLGLNEPVRWVVNKACTIVLESPVETNIKLTLRFRNSVPGQQAAVQLNEQAIGTAQFPVMGLRQSQTLDLALALGAGFNSVTLDFSGAVAPRPGEKRMRVLLLESLSVEIADQEPAPPGFAVTAEVCG